MIEVRFQRGLYLPELDLWLDPWDARPRAFVSHAHADHFARHDSALCSEVTAQLVHKRFHLAENKIEAVAFHVPIVRDGFRLRLLPAGHITGSAMLHITRTRDNASLLYTGDFKTRRGRTSEAVNFLNADTLILETTFGLPNFEFPGSMEIEASILRFVHDAFTDGETPVLFGYALGKAQEALALLTEHGIPALLHPTVAAMTTACREAGVETLPEPVEFDGHAPPGHVVIAPPNTIRSKLLRGLKSKRTAMLTGWALQKGAKYRYMVDEIFPLSDHADHTGLLECIQRIRPKRILTVHGFAREFATELRAKGMNAWCAMGGDQMELSINQAAQRGGNSGTIRHIRAICTLADFGDLCRLVGETSSRVAKTEYIATYLRGLATERELSLAATWLTGQALPHRSGQPALCVSDASIRLALLSLPSVREERYREISHAQNDTARTARLVLQEIQIRPEPLDLLGLETFFQTLLASGSLERISLLGARLATLHPVEGETIVKLLTGDLRIGLKEEVIEDAIALVFKADAAAVHHAQMLSGDLGETILLAKHGKLDEACLRPGVPIRCMLASAPDQNEGDTRTLFEKMPFGPPFWLEAKYDGIRVQLHKQGERVFLFARDLRPLNDTFPELIAAAGKLSGDFIIDGEIVAYTQGRRLRQRDLHKPLCRKQAGADLFLTDSSSQPAAPLRFIAFDLLWLEGRDLLDHPLLDRRLKLETLALTAPFETIAIYAAENPAEIEAVFKHSLQQDHEGLIAKDPSGFYTPGQRGKSWTKLKGVMPTLDCVVVIARQRSGLRSDFLTDYTFALRDETTGRLCMLGKAHSGLTDAELEELTAHFTRKTLRKERLKHHVEPDIVLEIAFDSIITSSRHDSGLALRFPRIKSIRRDKSVTDIDTLQSARKLLLF